MKILKDFNLNELNKKFENNLKLVMRSSFSWSERTAHIRDVGGSNPSSATYLKINTNI